ncbi:MAG: hypothetical protein GTO24_20470 [candidate division Zixibacteria bacterium]|nr:hypothetical protein [candidate division Zixibacteria bacterium]
MEREKRIRTVGIVVPVEWDEEGNAIKVALLTAHEKEYLIRENANSRRFLSLLRQEVDVTGTVREEAGQKVITVQHVRSLKRGRKR